MTNEQFLLTLAAEEAVEVAHRAHKAIRFTAAEIQAGQELSNADRLVIEYFELSVIMEMLEEKGIITVPTDTIVAQIMDEKRTRVEQYAKLSRMLGQIE